MPDHVLRDWRDRILGFFRNNNWLVTRKTVSPDNSDPRFARAGDRVGFPSSATMKTYARAQKTPSQRTRTETNALRNYWNLCCDVEGTPSSDEHQKWIDLLFGANMGEQATAEEGEQQVIVRPTLKTFLGYVKKLTHQRGLMVENAFEYLGVSAERVRQVKGEVIADICAVQGRDTAGFMRRDRAARGAPDEEQGGEVDGDYEGSEPADAEAAQGDDMVGDDVMDVDHGGFFEDGEEVVVEASPKRRRLDLAS